MQHVFCWCCQLSAPPFSDCCEGSWCLQILINFASLGWPTCYSRLSFYFYICNICDIVLLVWHMWVFSSVSAVQVKCGICFVYLIQLYYCFINFCTVVKIQLPLFVNPRRVMHVRACHVHTHTSPTPYTNVSSIWRDTHTLTWLFNRSETLIS